MSQIFKPESSTPPPPGFVETLTGNTGGAVGPDALDNINIIGIGAVNVSGNPATNTLTISAVVSSILNVTTVTHAQSPYTVVPTDEFLAVNVSGGVVTIDLPNSTTTGRVIYVKDSTGGSSTNNISVTTVGGIVTIDGLTTYTINSNYQAIGLIFDGTSYEVF